MKHGPISGRLGIGAKWEKCIYGETKRFSLKMRREVGPSEQPPLKK